MTTLFAMCWKELVLVKRLSDMAVIQRAVLVPYHPLAGRLREVEGCKLVLDCTGGDMAVVRHVLGVLFVKADVRLRPLFFDHSTSLK
jgi:benzyl alcohol O-benzoyltransferase